MCTFCIFFHVRPVVVISNPSNDDSAVAECLSSADRYFRRIKTIKDGSNQTNRKTIRAGDDFKTISINNVAEASGVLCKALRYCSCDLSYLVTHI